METKEMGFKDWELEDIINWCKEHNEIEWLKAEAAKKVERKVYPKVPSISKSGKKSWKQDKTQPYAIEYVPISFVELKSNFLSKFIDTTPKEKKPSMYEIIANL
jgi:hypothetical protein